MWPGACLNGSFAQKCVFSHLFPNRLQKEVAELRAAAAAETPPVAVATPEVVAPVVVDESPELRKEIASLKEECEALKSQLSSDDQDAIENLKQSLKRDIEGARKENSELIAGLTNDLELARKEKETGAELIAKQSKELLENREAVKQVSELSEALEKSKTQLNKLMQKRKAEKIEAAENLQQAQRRAEHGERDTTELMVKIKTLTLQLDSARDASKKSSKELIDARNQVAAVQKSQTADVNALRDTLKQQNSQVARAEEESNKLKQLAQKTQAALKEITEREKELSESFEKCKLELDRTKDALEFASTDKQNLLAEKKKQYEKLESERSDQVASLEAKLTELAGRLKSKHAALTEATVERDQYAVRETQRLESSEALASEKEEWMSCKTLLDARVSELSELLSCQKGELETTRMELDAVKGTSENRIRELEQSLVDLGLERNISEKKSVQLIKDLQSQLSKLQNGSGTPVLRRGSTMPVVHQRRKSATSETSPATALNTGGASGSSSRTSPRPQPSASGTAVKVDLSLLQEENNSLIHRITQMQQARWRLEERMKDLETLNGSLAEAAAQKSNIIRDYAMTVKTSRSDMQRETHRQDSRVHGLGNAPTPEVVAKLEQVLEDTLLKNMQLKHDLETLGDEVESLRLKNVDLQKLLNR